MNIYIFSLVEVKAYYSFDRNQSVSFSTAAYTNLSITTDKTTYGMCNKNAEINLTINNPNNYNINYTISINDSNLTYTIDGTSSSSYTMIKNGTNTHEIVLSGTTSNSSINIIVNVTSPYSSSYNKSINLDLVCPTCVFESPSQTTFLNGDTFAYTLTCTDASGIATPTLASSALTISNSSAFSITSITSTSITNGYKYTINAKAGSFNGEASISLKAGMVFDENGNSNVSVKSSNIKINNSVIVTFDPNGGSVTTNTKAVNYNSAYGDLPTPTRTGYRFDGWYTSATGGTVVNNTTIVTNSSAHTLYAHWSDIEAPVCTFGSFGNSSLSIRETTNIKLTCTDNVGVITNTLTSSSFTFSNSDAISISNITSSSITNGIVY
ncbi:MAG: InlB B-repeat-containing protein, partial [Erysipelotrichaceae bacterium]|nr:InlB B-repeat-containing protein [Erysipelotrichaceae bacterium]